MSQTAQKDRLELHTIIQAGRLLPLLDQLQAVVVECKLHISADGFGVRAVDAGAHCMVDASIPRESFTETPSGQIVLGVNLERFEDYLDGATGEDLVELSYDPETRRLHIQHTGVDVDMACIDTDQMRSEPDIPDLDLPSEPVMSGKALTYAVSMADKVSDHVTVQSDPENRSIRFDASGDIDDIDVEIGPNGSFDLLEGSHLPSEAYESMFSNALLSDITKVIPNDAEVHCQLGDEFPLVMDFEWGDGAGNTTFTLAPRVQRR